MNHCSLCDRSNNFGWCHCNLPLRGSPCPKAQVCALQQLKAAKAKHRPGLLWIEHLSSQTYSRSCWPWNFCLYLLCFYVQCLMVAHRSRTERNLSPRIFHCCCALLFHIHRIARQCQQWLWFGTLTVTSAHCHWLALVYIFLKCFVFQSHFDLSGVWLIFSFSRPPAPLETTTFPLFPAIPSTACEQSWSLMLCRWSLVWYDCAETLFAFQRQFLFGLCAAEGATVRETGNTLHELCHCHSRAVCLDPNSPLLSHVWRWRKDIRIMIYFPVSKAAQKILFLVLWSLNVWSWSVSVTGAET